jgi:hypothetical protein
MRSIKYFYKFLSIVLLLCCYNSYAQARWATLADASVEEKFANVEININKDGTSNIVGEVQLKILNERARSNSASFTMVYNGDSSALKILEAYTIYEGKKYKVNLKAIEDKPLASSPSGFDQTRQILISFPKVEIGSEIYLKYSRKITQVVMKNSYSDKFFYGTGGCTHNAHTKVTSKLPLYIEANDPENNLEITHDKKNNIIDIKLKKPICREIVYGSETGSINQDKYTWVTLSSEDNWDQYAKGSAINFQKIIDQPLPELFQPILEEARLEKSDIDRLNLITSLVNSKIRYMGDWMSVKGKVVPRDLKLVAKTQEGDCKDFTAVTAAILKAIGGYKVQPVLVYRGRGELSLPQRLPSPRSINHVFLKITNKEGKVYWVDPTNVVSMAQGIFPDIADKMVLVLDTQDPSYERTPTANPNNSKIVFTRSIEIDGENVIKSGELLLKGEEAMSVTGAGLSASKKQIRDEIFYIISGENLEESNKKDLIVPDLSSRIVSDLKFKFKYEQKNKLMKTNLGKAVGLTLGMIDPIINYVPNQLSDLYLGPPKSFDRNMIIKNIKVKNINVIDFEKDTKWLYIKRSSNYNGDNTEVHDRLVFKKTFITNEDTKTKEYKDLKRELEKNVKSVSIILD